MTRHEGAQSGAPLSAWMAAWRGAQAAIELLLAREATGELDHLPAAMVRDRMELLAHIAVLALVHTTEGRQN